MVRRCWATPATIPKRELGAVLLACRALAQGMGLERVCPSASCTPAAGLHRRFSLTSHGVGNPVNHLQLLLCHLAVTLS